MASSMSCRSVCGDFKVVRHYSKVLDRDTSIFFRQKDPSILKVICHSKYQSSDLTCRLLSRRWSTTQHKQKKLKECKSKRLLLGKSTLFLIPCGCNDISGAHVHNVSYHSSQRGIISHSCLKVEQPLIPPISAPKFMSSVRSSTHYYDTLGLSSKASQKQIKTAYYAMSKKYHPDVASDKRSHELFTQINEAYEVLGNIRKRRMYDKGMFNIRDQRVYHEEEDYTQSYRAKARESPFERGERPPPPTGRSKIYNFDEFYRQHYNDIREKQGQELRDYRLHKERMAAYGSDYHKSRLSSPLAFSLCMILVMVLMMGSDKLYDLDTVKRRKDDK